LVWLGILCVGYLENHYTSVVSDKTPVAVKIIIAKSYTSVVVSYLS